MRVAGGGDDGEGVVGVDGGHGGWCCFDVGVGAVEVVALENLLFLHC